MKNLLWKSNKSQGTRFIYGYFQRKNKELYFKLNVIGHDSIQRSKSVVGLNLIPALEGSGNVQAPAALPLGKEPPAPTEYYF
jgi:hypothetical protein